MSKRKSYLFSKWEKSLKKTSIKANSSLFKFLFPIFFLSTSFAHGKTWREEPEGTIGVKIGILNLGLEHEFKSEDKSITSFPKYKPYVPSRVFTEVSYSFFAVSISAPNALRQNDNEFYGSVSTAMDWQFRFYLNQHNFEAFLQEYEGFYLANSEVFDTSLNSNSPRLQRPDIKTTHYGLQYTYTVDADNYSLGSSFSQSTIQTESGGSWLLMAGVNQKGISADSPLVPASAASQYGELKDFKSGQFLTLKTGFGYGYNLIYNQFYLAGALMLSLSQQDQKYSLAGNSVQVWRPAKGYNLKLGLGYNGDKFHAGAQLLGDSDEISLGGAFDSITTLNAAVYVAYRF